MFRAINDWVIVKRDLADKKTESGIILTPTDEVQVLELEVHDTTPDKAELMGKIVMVERSRVRQLNPNSDVKFGAVKLEDILAIKHNDQKTPKPSK